MEQDFYAIEDFRPLLLKAGKDKVGGKKSKRRTIWLGTYYDIFLREED
jgi:hypothetical protein